MARGIVQESKKGMARELDALERLIARHVRHRRDLIAEASDATDRLRAVARAAAARYAPSRIGHRRPRSARSRLEVIVLTGSSESVSSLADAVRTRVEPTLDLTVVTLRPETGGRREDGVAEQHPDVLIASPARIIDHIRRDTIDLTAVSTVAVSLPKDENVEQFSADLHFIYAKLGRRPTTIVLVADLGKEFDSLEDLLRRPATATDTSWAPRSALSTPSSNEERTMSDLPVDPEQVKRRIEAALHAIHHDEDPLELNQYRRYVRKYTTMFNRGYLLAYLLKQSLDGQAGNGRPRRSRSESRQDETRTDKQSIFVSIGRSKRVRSRDLITFFTSADGIQQEDIGQVKVLDNFSFVEVTPDKAQAVVDELNGKELRGRKLTVNFARRK